MARIGSKTTIAYLRSVETRYGALPALLRQLADELESAPEITHDALKIVPRGSSTSWGIATDEWTVTVKGRRQNERLPAGVANICPICGGYGSNDDHGLDVWDDDQEGYRCIACGGSGYKTADAA